ncbi:MAG: APC family permease [Deltaproteobacteria bacterium]|nr:APC family permease [Deltaproteobacteria bacterium]
MNCTNLVALTFFCVAGGAFGLEDAVGSAGPLITIAAILILPWLWSFPTALMTAELSAAMPEDGGYVVWVEKAFGRFWGFLEGWLSWLCSFADNALYPVMFVDYLAYLRGDMGLTERWLIGAAMTASISWLNIRGIRLVGAASILFMLFVLAPFAVMVILGGAQIRPSPWLAQPPTVDWALLLSVVLWNTSGWDNAGCCAGEVDKPNRTYPRAMAISVLLVTLAYLLPVLVGVSIDTEWANWKEGYFPKVAAQAGGNWLGTWLTIAGLVSAMGLLNALLCTSARVPYAMAQRGTLPGCFARLHQRHATPWIAIIVNSAGVACLIPFSFKDLIQVDMFLYALALIIEFAALVWLRVRQPDMPRPYQVPLGIPGAIALSVAPVALCVLSIFLADELTKQVSLGGIVAGLAIFGWTAKRKPIPAPDRPELSV